MKNKGFSPILIIVIIVVSIVAIGAAFWAGTMNSVKLGKQTSLVAERTAIPFPTYIPTPTPDPTISWTQYVNPTHNFSFKYPPTWKIDTTNESPDINAEIKLAKDESAIHIVLNVDGIGGNGRDLNGVKITLDGHDLYEYKVAIPENNSILVGISDTLTQSLGFFKVADTTYLVTLNYPDSFKGQNSEGQLLLEFNQMLASIKFSK